MNATEGNAYPREVEAIYRQLLESWNKRSGAGMAALFAEGGNVVGFDGSQMDGRTAIEAELSRIFADHETAAYVGKVREVRLIAPDVVLLRAVAGLVPPGKSEINPAANSVQTLVVTKQDGTWRIALFQNTPAQFHGRPELVEQMTEELQQLVM
ncbi:MAG: SgcJ/EcaC family oxidoreductase [Caldilineaceae bacterium]|nr:SgcJ/EcaC family oxidoreductase [Caldilineaceae bacterium]